MKKKILVLSIVLVALGATAFKIADDIITRLGLEQQYAQTIILKNLLGRISTGPMESYIEDDPNNLSTEHNSFQIPYVKMLKNVITGDKVEAAKDLCKYVRTFVNSEEFINEYNRLKEDALPLMDKGSSISTLRGNKIVHEKNIKNYKTDTKYVAAQQKEMDENQVRLDALLEASKKDFPGKDKWEKAYPADPAVVVKKRLQEYLQIAATVDFKAELTAPDKYKKIKFINPAYEKKSLKWKAIFRAGKEVNDVVTAFVKDWMKGEIIAREKIKMTEEASTETNNNQNKTTPVNTPEAQTKKNENNTVKETTSATSSADNTETPVKKKKSLLNKIKDKTSSVIKN